MKQQRAGEVGCGFVGLRQVGFGVGGDRMWCVDVDVLGLSKS